MTEDRLVSLIIKKLSGELSPTEAVELEGWAQEDAGNRQFLTRNEGLMEREIERWKNIDPAEGYERWLRYRKTRKRTTILRITGWSVAAALLIAVAVMVLIEKMRPVVPAPGPIVQVERVLPGRNAAILTLSDGKRIVLDSAAKGELALQGNTHLVKNDSGSISYEAGSANVPIAMTYNVLATPKAGQYQLRLPDGSHVWLNNESSLRYPTAFSGNNRTVELTGEGYFEIVQDPGKPFIVKVGNESVEVLGTSFNVMAYAEEGIQTTLLTGAVKVTAGKSSVRLRPDDQAQLSVDGSLRVAHDVPSEDIISWKNGFFYFGRASFEAVMRQLARWYDVDVVYEGKVPEMDFGGKIDRSLPLNDVLKYLDKNQIHLRLEGRKLIVLPN